MVDMKCTFLPSQLSQGLSLVQRAVSQRSTLPVLGNVLIETVPGGLRLSATNLDLAIVNTVPAEVSKEGKTSVPAKLLADYIGSLLDVPCTMELDSHGRVLNLSCGLHKTKLHVIDPSEFPPLPLAEGGTSVIVDGKTFAAGVAQTVIAASNDETERVYTGVRIKVDPAAQTVTLAATDRHRLALKTLPAKEFPEGDEQLIVIVPAKHLQEVARAVNDERNEVAIALGGTTSFVTFTVGDVVVTTRTIEGRYPKVEQAIPDAAGTTVVLPTAELRREAKTASILAREESNPVRMSISNGTVVLTAWSSDVGDDEVPIPADVTGEGLEISFNSGYFLAALEALDSDTVHMSFNKAEEPGTIRPHGREDYVYLLMPVLHPALRPSL
ncbi:MAG: DNA polymerase III subunit beta [Candidatus Dormibacteria bacterium]